MGAGRTGPLFRPRTAIPKGLPMSCAFPHSAGQSRKVARACCIEFRRLVRGLDCGSVRPRQERTLLNNVAQTDVFGSFQVHYVRAVLSISDVGFRVGSFRSEILCPRGLVHASCPSCHHVKRQHGDSPLQRDIRRRAAEGIQRGRLETACDLLRTTRLPPAVSRPLASRPRT